jgi:hypothetical protein
MLQLSKLEVRGWELERAFRRANAQPQKNWSSWISANRLSAQGSSLKPAPSHIQGLAEKSRTHVRKEQRLVVQRRHLADIY